MQGWLSPLLNKWHPPAKETGINCFMRAYISSMTGTTPKRQIYTLSQAQSFIYRVRATKSHVQSPAKIPMQTHNLSCSHLRTSIRQHRRMKALVFNANPLPHRQCCSRSSMQYSYWPRVRRECNQINLSFPSGSGNSVYTHVCPKWHVVIHPTAPFLDGRQSCQETSLLGLNSETFWPAVKRFR